MKTKLRRFFSRRLHNDLVVSFCTLCAYIALRASYYVLRLFLHSRCQISVGEAAVRINAIRPRPDGGFVPAKYVESSPDIDFSVIVPVYNIEKYIDECLDSIVSQETGYRFEIIVVNDGSTDKSAAIISRYANSGSVVLVQKANGGLSSARNAALDLAKGRYLMFVDGDDRLLPGCLDKVLKTIYCRNADIVQFRHRTFGNGVLSVESDEPAAVITGDIPPDVYPGLAWGKCYKRALFSQIRFPEGYIFEDTITQYLLFNLCKTFVCVEDIFYEYRIRPASITASMKGNASSIDTYWVTLLCLEYAQTMGIGRAGYLYQLTLRQFSGMQRSRLNWMPDGDRKAIFVLFAEQIARMRDAEIQQTGMLRDVEKAFLTHDYALWKMCSIMIA